MRKYKILTILTLLLVGAVLVYPSVSKLLCTQVYITQMKPIAYARYVNATGTISSRSKTTMTTSIPVIPQTIYFAEGDEIQEGDVIATIDVAQTVAAFAKLQEELGASVFDASALLSQYVGSSLDQSVGNYAIPTTIVSEISGKIVDLNITEGTMLSIGDTILSISNLNDLLIVASVDEANIADVIVGQTVSITGSGFKGREYEGIIEKISPTAKRQTSGLVQSTGVNVTVKIVNPDAYLKIGFTAKIAIKADEKENIMAVPYESVQQDEDNQEYVYVYSEEYVEKRFVETGIETADGVEIVSGLKEEEIIIYDANTFSGDSGRVVVVGWVK